MKQILWLVPVLVLAAHLAPAADDPGSKTPGSGNSATGPKNYVPPVMRTDAPGDTVIVLLPGPAPDPPPPAPKVSAPPAVAPVATPAEEAKAAASADEAIAGPRPYFHRIEKVYPDDFDKDTLKYFQERIGKWTEDQVAEVLGTANRQRAAYGEDQKENGSIYAFSDPTNKYREFELDFDGNTGMLRTVFAYPLQMTWQDCRRQFGAKVTATDASKGRKFYSYADRRLDVLVGPDGKVVSLGLY